MALKAVVASLDEVNEQFHNLYVQVGDEYVLDLDDADYKSKLSEFRNNNIDLRKKVEGATKLEAELKAAREQLEKYASIGDPEAAAAAPEKVQNIEDQKLIEAGKLDELLAQRTERMRQDLEAQTNAALDAKRKAEEQANVAMNRLSEVVIDSSLQNAVTSVAAVRKGAMRDILSRGKDVWKLDDKGVPVPRKPDGTIMYGKDGEHPVSMEEWAQGLRNEAPYLFEGHTGGGADGNLEGGDGSRVVLADDQRGISDNIESIAAGETVVVRK